MQKKILLLMLSKFTCFLLLMATPAWAETIPTADEIIGQVAAQDKQLVQRRKAFDYDIEITREKLDSNRKVVSSERENAVVAGDRPPGYETRPEEADPEQEAKKTSREEPFELLKILDHYTFTL